MFDNSKKYRLVTYFNADWAVNIKNWKSTTEFLIKIAETLIYWKLIKQTNILLSTTEIEYIAVSEIAKNVIITYKILYKLNIILKDFIFSLLIDNTDVITISEDEKIIRNTKHINIQYHHIQDLIEKKMIEIFYISTNEITVNDFTKILLSNKFKKFVELIRISKIKFSNNKLSNSKSNNDNKNNKITEHFYIKKKTLFHKNFHEKSVLFWAFFKLF